MPWAPDYTSPEELADYLRIDAESDRPALTLACTSASRAIDMATYRQFGQTAAEARFFTPKWSTKLGMWVIECDDLFAAPTAIAFDSAGDGSFSTAVDPTTAALMLPANNAVKGRPYERVAIRRSVSVLNPLGPDSARLTAVWGWPSVPTTISAASRLQATRFFNRRNSPYGIAGSPDQGSEVRLLARVDPDVKLMIRPYRRDVWLS